MATITAPVEHQLKPLSFTTGDWPRCEFWLLNLQPILLTGLLACSWVLQIPHLRSPLVRYFPWIFLGLGVVQIFNFLWKLRNSIQTRWEANRYLKELTPRLSLQIESRSLPLWIRFAVKILLLIILIFCAGLVIRVLQSSKSELSIFWFAIGVIGLTGMFLAILIQIVVDLWRIGKMPTEEFRFYDVGLVWANRPPGWGLKPKNDFFPWSSITGIVWRKSAPWIPATLEIRSSDLQWDRWISFKRLSEEDRETLLDNLAQYVSVTRE